VITLFTGIRSPSPASVETYYRNLRERQAWCRGRGIGFRATIFPEKLFALSKYVDLDVRSLFRDVYAVSPQNDASLPHLYIDRELAGCEGYFRTDTHLNLAGLRAALTAVLADDFGADAVATYQAYVDRNLQDAKSYIGDLGRKFEPPRDEVIQRLRPQERFTIQSNGVKAGNDGLMLIAENPESITERRLLIFGDSFFRQMLPHLAWFYRSIVFCRTRYFHYELVDAVKPDAIYTGMAERYLSQCSPDADRPHFLAYPAIKGKPLDPDPGFAESFQRHIDMKALIA
jgi:hypothetical protein